MHSLLTWVNVQKDGHTTERDPRIKILVQAPTIFFCFGQKPTSANWNMENFKDACGKWHVYHMIKFH